MIDTVRVQQGEEYYRLGNNSLQKNKHGLWELYVEGNPLERGLAIGSLSRSLHEHQVVVGRDGRLTGLAFKNALHSPFLLLTP